MSTQRSIAGCIALGLVAAAQADLAPVPPGPPQRIDPWMPYSGAGNDDQDVPVYASLELDPGCGTCAPNCEVYLLKEDNGKLVNSPTTISNMAVADEFRGVECGRARFTWYWTEAGNGTYFVAVFTAEDVSTDCSLPAVDNAYDGIVLEFADDVSTSSVSSTTSMPGTRTPTATATTPSTSSTSSAS